MGAWPIYDLYMGAWQGPGQLATGSQTPRPPDVVSPVPECVLQEQRDPAAHPSQAKISVAAVDVVAAADVVDVVDFVQAPADDHRAIHAPAPFADAELVEPLPAEQHDPPPAAPSPPGAEPAAFGLPEDWAQQLSALTEMMSFEPAAAAAALLEQRGNVQLAVAQLIG